MAVSIDKVYQKVLALANKEQRGYITPQEFNLFADQAQMEIFQQYFYDIDQLERRVNDDMGKFIKSKIEIFKDFATTINHNDTLPSNIYFIDSIFLNRSNGKQVPVEKMDRDDSYNIWAATSKRPLLKSYESRPTYSIIGNKILFRPNNIGGYFYNIIRKPITPNWTYLIDPTTKNALYNPNAMDHQNFELHLSEEGNLVIKILQFAGVSIKDVNLTQYSVGKEVATEQKQKQ